MSYRSAWEQEKKKYQPPIPKDFFGKSNLGPLLEKAEKAESEYFKLPGTAPHQKITEYKKKAYDAYADAHKVLSNYIKLADMAEKANGKNDELKNAFHEINSFLAFHLRAPIKDKLARLKPK